MSYKHVRLVFQTSNAKGLARLVLVYLAERANADGYCFPGVKTIARECNANPRSVQQAITQLIELGELEADRKGGRNKASEYWIKLKGVENLHPLSNRKDEGFEQKGCRSEAERVKVYDVKGEGNLHPNHKNRKKNHKEPGGSSDLESILRKHTTLDTPEFRDTWNRWLRHLSERNATLLTPTSTETQFEQFSEWGVEVAITSINKAIRSGWKTIHKGEPSDLAKPKNSPHEPDGWREILNRLKIANPQDDQFYHANPSWEWKDQQSAVQNRIITSIKSNDAAS